MAPNIPVEIRKQIASQLEAQEAEIKVLEAVLKMQKIKTAYLSEVDNEPELPFFEKRLRELCVRGWYDGKQGEKVSLTSVDNSRILLTRLHQDKPSLVPSISPSIEGEILLSYKGISIQVAPRQSTSNSSLIKCLRPQMRVLASLAAFSFCLAESFW